MHNPISIPVIRQAIKWHGVDPLSIRRQDQIKMPTGTLITSYVIELDPAALRTILKTKPLKRDSKVGRIATFIHDCFCDDIRVFDVIYNADLDRIFVYVNTTFKKRNE